MSIAAGGTKIIAKQNLESKIVSIIHRCESFFRLKQVHAHLIRSGLSDSDYPATQVISAASLFGSTDYVLKIISSFRRPTIGLFNSAIRALSDAQCFSRAVSQLVVLLRCGLRPNRLTLSFVLDSCGQLPNALLGIASHSLVVRVGLYSDTFVLINLVGMYVKIGCLESARQVFDETPKWVKGNSVLLWNVMINGYCKSDMRKACQLFHEMPERKISSWNSLISGFLKHGLTAEAAVYFERMPHRDVVSWTTMISGYMQNEEHDRALRMFFRMLETEVKPNEFTLVSALCTCARLGALESGIQIYNYIRRNNFQVNASIGPALVDMFAKCGDVQAAYEVFCEMPRKNLVTWSNMISGFAMHGFCDRALQLFNEMKFAGIQPDDVVFLAALSACAHAGRVELGIRHFESMTKDYGIMPTVKHYSSMVDLFGRCGRFDEALNFIKSMPIKPDYVIWGALFSTCRAHKNTKVAEFSVARLLELEPRHPGSYIFLSNLYAATGRWAEVERVRCAMKNKQIKKAPGWSYIEVGSKVHEFVAGDSTHELTGEIYQKLEEIIAQAKLIGYMPETGWVLHSVEEEEKEDALGRHSEKLALSFGLIATDPGTTLRIVKNLRVCGDCHTLMKFVSTMGEPKRLIILRDLKRFHHFKSGVCSCGDYW